MSSLGSNQDSKSGPHRMIKLIIHLCTVAINRISVIEVVNCARIVPNLPGHTVTPDEVFHNVPAGTFRQFAPIPAHTQAPEFDEQPAQGRSRRAHK